MVCGSYYIGWSFFVTILKLSPGEVQAGKPCAAYYLRETIDVWRRRVGFIVARVKPSSKIVLIKLKGYRLMLGFWSNQKLLGFIKFNIKTEVLNVHQSNIIIRKCQWNKWVFEILFVIRIANDDFYHFLNELIFYDAGLRQLTNVEMKNIVKLTHFMGCEKTYCEGLNVWNRIVII